MTPPSLRPRFPAPFLVACAALALIVAACSSHPPRASLAQPSAPTADVCIYGATPAGIAAAIAAGKAGHAVLLIEPTTRIGGLVTCGLSHTDFRSFEGLNGTFLDFTRRVEAHYRAKYGAASPQVRDSFRGTFAEPAVNLLVFERMLAEMPTVKVWQCNELVSAQTTRSASGTRIDSILVASPDGRRERVRARVFIDATYEGDLMAAAGVPHRIGREARSEYGESLAPETADGQVQGYNFRLIMTREATNRVTPLAPAGYRRKEFTGVLPLLESGQIKRVFDYPSGCIFKAQLPPLPNGKYDINDVSRGLLRLSLPGENYAWPAGAAATRRRIFDTHVRWNIGLLYFLQNDPAVPAKFRDEARQWGWCRDEFAGSGHLPPQLYVREARRMVGQYVFTEKDTDHAPDDARAVLRREAVAIGDYGPNCHGTAHEGPRFGGRHTGEFYKQVVPYQVSYGALVPRDCVNLLVPVAASSSHVGFCALRLEPIWTSLGQAAGHAASLALTGNLPVQRVPVTQLQRRLHAEGAATIYVSDVLPGSPDFAAVQWWGTHGGLHGLAPMPAKPGQRGKNIHGQYYEAFPGHEARLEAPLDAPVKARWLALARSVGVADPALERETTRGGFLRLAHRLHLIGR